MEKPRDEEFTFTKRQVRDTVPKRIKEFQFGVLSCADLVRQGVTEITERHIYELTDTNVGAPRTITRDGPLDRRLGTANNAIHCSTCDLPLRHCNGHFGFVKLALPVFHIGFLKKTIEILHCICKECGWVLLDHATRRTFVRPLSRPNMDNMEHKAVIRRVIAECRKVKVCPHCKEINGSVKKVPGHALKIIHERYRAFPDSTKEKKRKQPYSKLEYLRSFEALGEDHPDLKLCSKKAVDDMNPLRVLSLFKKTPLPDYTFLGLKQKNSQLLSLIWQYVPAPPVSIRPSVAQEGSTTEDDTTNKLGDIIQISSIIKAGLERGQPISTVLEQWDFLQIQVAMYINSEVPNLQQAGFSKPIRGFCQRLKGKQGRFRGNLSGKRVDFSGRTVISPDPNLGIDEVAVPMRVAKGLTYPEKVTPRNLVQLQQAVSNGPDRWPGANLIKKLRGQTRNLKRIDPRGLLKNAESLAMGDIVHRHLRDDDIVLFNRQPSLHKLSIMSHKIKVRNWRTFRLNECVCKPYNADFDGDEMNLHVPQTEEARVEATELMGVKHNLATPKDGTPIIAATQDFITAAYLLSSKERFYSRTAFAQICNYMFDGDAVHDNRSGLLNFHKIDIPPPTILRPEMLWTGKQVFNVLMRPSQKSEVLVNLDAQCREYTKDDEKYNREDDQFFVVRNSEVMSGVMDKNILGDGKKDSMFYVLLRDFGPDSAVAAMNRLAKLAARWLSNEGFSIGIKDVYPSRELAKSKQNLIKDAYEKCDSLIRQLNAGNLGRDAGCNEEQTMENSISGILSSVRQSAGKTCFEHLSRWNSPIIMARSGAKGSNINVAQMVATVGQQIINSQRVEDGFQDRTLPHFPKAARQPPSKGFVANSFFNGLNPTEFIFHAMSGREGLVDTAVKTAETGYMSRRLMKSLEDLSAQYDDTVRNSAAGIVQFQFGEDGLDPLDMEGKAKPVNFERTFLHAQTTQWSSNDQALNPEEVTESCRRFLQDRYKRITHDVIVQNLLAQPNSNHDDGRQDGTLDSADSKTIDEYESKRVFIADIERFIATQVDLLSKAKNHFASTPPATKARPKRGRRIIEQSDSALDASRCADGVMKISQKSLDLFLDLCMRKYEKAKVEPGHAVGAVGAQSIGEPGTQMTLKTFHFAGVAGMSMTQGVPRIKEIINASKAISTPLITCSLGNKRDEWSARAAKSRIERTYLKDVLSSIEQIYARKRRVLRLTINTQIIKELELDLPLSRIKQVLIGTRGLGLRGSKPTLKGIKPGNIHIRTDNIITIYPDQGICAYRPHARARASNKSEYPDLHMRAQYLMRAIPEVAVAGYPLATRAVITKAGEKDEEGVEENKLMVEGYGLKECMNTPGVDGRKTTTNNVDEVYKCLGIEAARSSIISELKEVMGNQMDIDPRHMQLLADVMTFKGTVLGITRFGLAKMRDSVLQLASFEKTPDHLFEAAIAGQSDQVEGVSECIIMGQSMSLGTGAMKVVRPLGLVEEDLRPGPTLFEEACAA